MGLPGRRRLLLDRDQGYIGVALLAEEETEMKTIGLLGGMSWESSIEYERLLERGVHTVTEQAAKVDDLVDEASSPASKPRSRAP